METTFNLWLQQINSTRLPSGFLVKNGSSEVPDNIRTPYGGFCSFSRHTDKITQSSARKISTPTSNKYIYFLFKYTREIKHSQGKERHAIKCDFLKGGKWSFSVKNSPKFLVWSLTSNPENIWCVRHDSLMAGVSYLKLWSVRITNVKFFMETVHYSTENVIHHTRTQPLLFASKRTTRLLTSRTERILSRRYKREQVRRLA